MLSKGGDFDLWESLKVNSDKDREGKIICVCVYIYIYIYIYLYIILMLEGEKEDLNASKKHLSMNRHCHNLKMQNY